MLVNAEGTQRVLGCLDGANLVLHPDIPQLDLPIATGADELAHTSALHVHIRDPLLVAAVTLDHGVDGLLALVIDLDLAVAEASDEDVARDLIGGEGCDAGVRTRGKLLRVV